MARKRTTTQVLRDWVTVPLRLDSAIWETIQAAMGEESWGSAWRVLSDPNSAKPEDLALFSERFLHLQPGWKSFLADTAISPTMLFGIGFLKGGQMLGHSKPSGVGKVAAQQFGDLTTNSALVQHFRQIDEQFARDGWLMPKKAALIANARERAVFNKLYQQYQDAKNLFFQESGVTNKQWKNYHQKRVALMFSEFSDHVPNPTVAERNLVNRWRTLFDDAYPLISIVDETNEVVDAEELAKAFAGGNFAMAPIMKYIHAYLPRMVEPTGVLKTSSKRINQYLRDSKMVQQLMSMGEMEAGIPDEYFEAKSRHAVINQMNRPGFRKMLNKYRLKRSIHLEDVGEFENLFVLDPDKFIPDYIQRTARTVALQTPLSPAEMLRLHGYIPEGAIDPSVITDLGRRFRDASRAGDNATRTAVNLEAAQVLGQLSKVPEQRSLYVQLLNDASKRIPGYLPLGQRGTEIGKISKDGPRLMAKQFGMFIGSLTGKHDYRDYWLARGMADVYGTMGKILDNPSARKAADGLLGEKNATRVRDWLVGGADLHTALDRERFLTNWVYANLLGFRPIAGLVNLMQTPIITGSDMGFGNTLAGLTEATPKVWGAYKEALKNWKWNKVRFSDALDEAVKHHLPEMYEMGLVGDVRAQEIGVQVLQNRGLSGMIEAGLEPFFKPTELLNRSTAFYGARRGYQNLLKTRPSYFGFDYRTVEPSHLNYVVNQEAANTAARTQFIAMPGRTTAFQSTFGPAARQFSSYPLGFTNWLLDAPFRAAFDDAIEGAASAHVQATGSKFNGLPYLRFFVTANGLANFSRDILGLDMDDRVMGGINLPLDSQAFAPLPIPPVPGTIVGAADAALSGDIDKLNPVELPYVGKIPIPKAFFPAGLFISQAAKIMNQLDGSYLTDSQGRRTEPMSQTQAVLKALGFTTSESARDDMKVRQILNAQERLKEYRRRLATALSRGDEGEANRVRAEAQGDFGNTFQLSVTRSDIRRVRSSMESTRLKRILKSTSPSIRQRFGLIDPDFDPQGFYKFSAETGIPMDIPSGF